MAAGGETVQSIRRGQGRHLAWTELGDPDGQPVLAFHGAPACRLLFLPADGPARLRGLKLIAPDRPGYGRSDPLPGRTLADWSADVAALLDHLGVTAVPVFAISGGAPYAVAAAAHLGARVTGLALVSPLAEIGAVAARDQVSRLERAFFLGLPRYPALLRRSAQVGRAAFLAAPDLALSSFAATLPVADRQILGLPAARRVMIEMTREAVQQGIEGAVSDMAIFGRPWGIDVDRIRVPTLLWQGTADTIVPVGLAFDLAHRLGGAHVVRLEGAGHFWGLTHAAEVIDALAGLVGRP